MTAKPKAESKAKTRETLTVSRTATADELRAERTSTANKISGVNTQIKRNMGKDSGAKRDARLAALETRLGKLIDHRKALTKRIDQLDAKTAKTPADDLQNQAKAAAA